MSTTNNFLSELSLHNYAVKRFDAEILKVVHLFDFAWFMYFLSSD